MDPLSSLSVASSAIQIFDFSSKLWKQIRELYQSESGATLAQETLLSNAERLCSLNSGLSKLLTPENLQRMPTTIEENVVSLCNECDSAAEDLVATLQGLTLSRGSDVSGSRLGFLGGMVLTFPRIKQMYQQTIHQMRGNGRPCSRPRAENVGARSSLGRIGMWFDLQSKGSG
jgi:hypothetical protein